MSLLKMFHLCYMLTNAVITIAITMLLNGRLNGFIYLLFYMTLFASFSVQDHWYHEEQRVVHN